MLQSKLANSHNGQEFQDAMQKFYGDEGQKDPRKEGEFVKGVLFSCVGNTSSGVHWNLEASCGCEHLWIDFREYSAIGIGGRGEDPEREEEQFQESGDKRPAVKEMRLWPERYY